MQIFDEVLSFSYVSDEKKIRKSTDDEKEADAYAFAKKYKRDVGKFIDFICDSDFSVMGDYKESWEYIESGLNSIDRHTNFGICIKGELYP